MKFKTYLTYILLPVLCCSCGNEGSEPLDIEAMVQYVPIQTQVSGRWGMMDIYGHMVFEDEFVDMPSLAINGIFNVAEGDGISLYAVSDQPRLVGECEHLLQAGYFNNGLVPVAKAGERISVVDKDGAVKFELGPIDGKEIVGCSKMYSDNLLVVTNSEGLSGCVDLKGDAAITPKYASICDFSGGYALATLPGGNCVVIDKAGVEVCELMSGYKSVSRKIDYGEFVVADTAGFMAFANLKGEISKLPQKVKAVGEYNDDVLAFLADNDFWGLMSRKRGNEMLMRPKFKSIDILDGEPNYLVNLDDSWSIINIQGKKIVDFDTRYTQVVATGYKSNVKYLAHDHAGWVLLDEQGNEIHTGFNIYDIAYKFEAESTAQLGATYQAPKKAVSIVDDVLAQITLNSLCGIQLNAVGNKWYKNQNPADFGDSKEFTPDSIPDLKAIGDVTVIGVTDKQISVAMRVNGQTGAIEYAFMPTNAVAAIELDIVTASTDTFAKSKAEFIEKLKEKGFTLVDESEEEILMKSQYANLEISTDDGKTITVLMYRL